MNTKLKKEEFDLLIKQLFDNEELFGYDCNGKVYNLYYSKKEFEKFKKGMSDNHRKAYDVGAGGELREKERQGIIYPPKMASVASSSRFCYLALCNGIDIMVGDVHIKGTPSFEKVCVIDKTFVTPPHLDAFFEETDCYFEVKCHEIFDKHKIVLKEKYWKLIYGIENDFKFEPQERPLNEFKEFEIQPSVFGLSDKKTPMFDIKQLICHLLGISKQQGKDKKLVYMFFMPDTSKLEEKSNDDRVQKLFDELQTEIKCIFNSNPIKNYCKKNNIKLIAIAEKSKIMQPLTNQNMVALFDEN